VCRVDEPFNMQILGLQGERGFNIELLSVLRMTIEVELTLGGIVTRKILAPWH